MREWIWTVSILVAFLSVGAVIVGCSGAGVSAGGVAGASVQALAIDQVSAVVLLRSWLAVLYPPLATSSPCSTDTHWEILPDGSQHLWGTNSDCSTYDVVRNPDRSGHWTVTYADSRQATATWTAPVVVGARQTYSMLQTTADGTHLDYTVAQEVRAGLARHTHDGTITLADGRAMDFTWDRNQEEADEVALALPDGSRLSFRVPVHALTGTGRTYWPVFSTGLTGQYTAPDGTTLALEVTGADNAWTQWSTQASTGTAGAFALGEGLSGSGQFTNGGRLVGAFRWTAQGAGTLDQAGAASDAVTPTGAARAFGLDQWVASVAALSPSPMY